MSNMFNQVLSALCVKGVTVSGGPSSANYLVKTDNLGKLNPDILPLTLTMYPKVTYHVDAVNGLSPSNGGTGSAMQPFLTIADAVAANSAESSGGSPFTIILHRGSYAGITITNKKQTRIAIVAETPYESVITSAIQIMFSDPLVAAEVDLYGVVVSAGISRPESGAFTVYLAGRSVVDSVTAVSGTPREVYVFPGSTVNSVTNVTKKWVTDSDKVNYTVAVPSNWSPEPVLVANALDQLVSRLVITENELSDNTMKLDGTSEFKNAISKLFAINRTGYKTTVKYITPSTNADVIIPNRNGILPVIDDSSGSSDTDATWSANKLVATFTTKADKITGGTPGAIVILDSNTPSNIADSTYVFGKLSGNVPRYVDDNTLEANAIKEITSGHGVDILGLTVGNAKLSITTGIDNGVAELYWLHKDTSTEGWVASYTENTSTSVALQIKPIIGASAQNAIAVFEYTAGTYLSTIKGNVELTDGSINIATGQLYKINGVQHTHDSVDIVSGTLDGDRLPAMSVSKKGAVPPTGTPSGKFLKDDGTWSSVSGANDQSGTSYTLVLGDAGKTVWMNNASANTVTIPTNASVAFPVNTVVCVVMEGAGTTTITASSGVTLNGVSGGSGAIQAQYTSVALVKRGTDAWVAIGNIGSIA